MSQLGIFNASDRPSTSMHRSSKIWALRSRRRPWTSWYTRPGSGTTQPFNPKKDQSRKKGTGNLIFKTIVLSLLNHFTHISRDLYGYLMLFMDIYGFEAQEKNIKNTSMESQARVRGAIVNRTEDTNLDYATGARITENQGRSWKNGGGQDDWRFYCLD